MDLYTLYDWITSILRPRGRYKCIENQKQQEHQQQLQLETTSLTTTTTQSTDSPHNTIEYVPPTINNVELIPTLKFIIEEPRNEQHVAATCVSKNESNDDDNDSRRTFIITTTASSPPTTSADDDASSDAELQQQQQQQEVNLSITNTDTSFVDEPTSSISIEMDTFDNTTTRSSVTTTPATPSSSRTPATTNSSRNIMTTNTSDQSSDQSIEEEIEEAIELTDDAPDGGTEEEDQGGGGSSKPSRADPFSIGALESEQGSLSAEKVRTSDDAEFEIDDDQLSGGKLAQHFVLDDDDDEDEDDVDFDISLPMEKQLEHSRHEDEDRLSEVQKESLSHQNTADDVSDFMDDVRHDVVDGEEEQEETGASMSDAIDLPLPDDGEPSLDASGKKVKESREEETPLTRVSGSEKKTSESLEKPLLQEVSRSELQEVSTSQRSKGGQSPVLMELTGASPEHSEKDHSMEEIVATNQSIEITFDDKDLSSLNPSFDLHNETLVNRLLADTPTEMPGKEDEILEQSTEEKSLERSEGKLPLSSLPRIQQKSSEISSEETIEKKTIVQIHEQREPKEAKYSTLVVESFDITPQRPQMTEHKKAEARETLELRPEVVETFEKFPLTQETLRQTPTEAVEINLDTNSDEEEDQLEPPMLSDFDQASFAACDLFEALGRHYEAMKNVRSSPEPTDAVDDEDDDDEDNAMEMMKMRIMAMKQQQQQATKDSPESTEIGESSTVAAAAQVVKQMERVPLTEFSKDVLEDITEESERNSLSTVDEQQTLSLEEKSETADAVKSEASSHTQTLQPPEANESSSIVSLNMIQMLEQKVNDLQDMLATKDACLASLNLQLETSQRRGSNGGNGEQPMSSSRESSSLITNSTEYRTFQEDFGAGPTMDFYMELTKRDELIAKLTDSLQQSVNVRENLQTESEKLTNEVQQLRKQLTEAMDTLRRPMWPRDQESNGGQRISEISMDLISESDDDELDRQFLTDNEDKVSRNSRERQLSMPRQLDDYYHQESTDYSQAAFSRQMEQFQKYLTPNEVRLFFMVQQKFDDFLSQELEKCKMKHDHELKMLVEQLESEKQEKDNEIKRLLQQRFEKDALHSKEMEDLRKYFETKCADLEKQFSDEVFSQKSQHRSADTSSDGSDQEQMPEEVVSSSAPRSKESSPRKRTRAELLLSPSHRQMTPSGDGTFGENQESHEIVELRAFYQQKMHEQQRVHDENLRKVSEKLHYYENRYPEDDFMTANNNTSLIIIDKDELNMNNESQVIQKIIEEYEKRLQEQLALAREDIVHELENQIQTLLSETTSDDHHWPPELILLREKFTAKSQLEIAQLQIKHEEEMSRLKIEYEKQLNRKNKRHSTFDSARDLDQIISERDGLRELSKTFRHVLAELAKSVANSETNLNATLLDEVHRLVSSNRTAEEEPLDSNLNNSTLLNASLNSTIVSQAVNSSRLLVPDVHSLLEIIEDPNLKDFISNKNSGVADNDDFDLQDCLERLKSEASYLLHLSEDQKRKRQTSESSGGAEKNDSCCEAEDGLKITLQHPAHKFLRTHSLNEQQLSTWPNVKTQHVLLNSLPPSLNRHDADDDGGDAYSTPGNASELNCQLHELRNRLLKSESDRLKLQQELEHNIRRNTELGSELATLRDQFGQLDSLNRTDYAEGYGLATLKSPQRHGGDNPSTNFAQLQERARNLLSTPTQQKQQQQEQQHQNSGVGDTTVVLLQMIEDFCREGDKVVESSKKDREDLQSQIDTADKQLRATRQFLEEQAAEREQERDEFLREIERLKLMLRDKEKERNSYENASKEVEQLESQIRDLNQKLNESNAKRDKFEVELKASIDKIFVLREIISELETQVETKSLNEHVLTEKSKHLEEFINSQTHSNESLQQEVHSLKTEISQNYQERIRQLEEKLQNIRPSAEQSLVLDQVIEQLRDVENTLDQKTKTLESLHNSLASNSCSLSGTEDVSKSSAPPLLDAAGALVSPPQGSPVHPSPRQHSLSMEGVQRIVDKLSKHTRVEEAAIKRIRDLEMQITNMRSSCVELQHERDSLQDRMSEQMQRIASLQTRLEEQRQRAEELQRAGTSDLNIRIHDLQNEVQTLRETLTSRDKQITTLRQQLEKSKVAIDRLEAELAVEQNPDRSMVERLEAELKQKNVEVQKLKEKIKTEMINKLALPDLMETMLADKNDEIDHLKEQLEAKEKELLEHSESRHSSSVKDEVKDEASTKLSARTLSDILSITEFDEPDVIRRAAANNADTPLVLAEAGATYLQQTMETSKEAVANLTHKRTEELAVFSNLRPANTFDNPHYFQDPNVLLTSGQSVANSITPALVPRQINFSAFTEDSKSKQSTPTSNFFFDTPEQRLAPQSLNKTAEKMELERLREQLEEAKEAQQKIERLRKELEEAKEALQKTEKEKNEMVESKQKEVDDLYEENMLKSKEIENHLRRIAELEANLSALEADSNKVKSLEKELQSLKNQLQTLRESHAQFTTIVETHAKCKDQVDALNQEIKSKDERLVALATQLSINEDSSRHWQQQIASMEQEIEKLRSQQSESSSKQLSVDEIAQQVEKELNYSAQLDSNILKAIESEEENNLDRSPKESTKATPETEQHNGTDDENFTGERELLNQLEALRAQIQVEREQAAEVREELMAEKQHSQDIQEQDVILIEAMRKRLETALAQEDDLHKMLDQEREKSERLQSQLTVLQRSDSRRNSALLKSPTESPRKSPRSSDFESEVADRLRSEIKLLTSQNERERERSADLQRNLERERSRFETELKDRIDYSDRLKREMEKLARDKELAEQELEHLQERLLLQSQEIESLEARIAALQEAETRQTTRRERQRLESTQTAAELHELRTKLATLETERDNLTQTVTLLRFDIERSASREAKLTEALAKSGNAAGESSIPQQFLQKMKEINALLAENTKENRQMAETVQYLVEERRQLQKKCEELESQVNCNMNVGELEERCNHLLGRYLRVESHRKALVYQKRYLKISLQSYQESEARAMAAMREGGQVVDPPRNMKRVFKTVALAIIAIQRMKYIGRIWHTGKRIVSKSVFTITQQKRSQPPTICAATTPTSPTTPSTPREPFSPMQPTCSPYGPLDQRLAPLKAPALLNECPAPQKDTTSVSRTRQQLRQLH